MIPALPTSFKGSVCVCPGIRSGESSLLRDQVTRTLRVTAFRTTSVTTQAGLEYGDSRSSGMETC